jgi:hypothetical protein
MRIPLHPGTHLLCRRSMQKLHDEWVCATPHKRDQIVMDIIYELETFGEVYQSQAEALIEHSLANQDYTI